MFRCPIPLVVSNPNRYRLVGLNYTNTITHHRPIPPVTPTPLVAGAMEIKLNYCPIPLVTLKKSRYRLMGLIKIQIWPIPLVASNPSLYRLVALGKGVPIPLVVVANPDTVGGTPSPPFYSKLLL